MKKFFTLVAAAVAALTVNAELMTFPEGSPLAVGSTFTTANLTLTVTADTDSKMAIDANSTYFEPNAPIQFATRLKSGGKSSSKLGLKLTASESGTLKIYARTGSNSATDRNVVLTQNGVELFNEIMLESNSSEGITIEGEADPKKVYYSYTATVGAGDIEITFPVGSINFYGFELIAGEGPTTGGEGGEQNQGEPLHFNALTANDFANLVNGEMTTYTMDGVEGASINYTGADAAEMTFDCRGVQFGYKNSGTKNNAVKVGAEFIQLDSKNFTVTVNRVLAGQTVNLYVSAKGNTDATFMLGETQLGTAAKASSTDAYTVISYTATENGAVKIKETTGGFRMTKIEITDAPVQKLAYSVEVPAGTWECYIAGEFNQWGFTKMNKVDANHYSIELVGATEEMGYKYCAGPDWAYVETAADGSDVSNRTYNPTAADVVAAWKAIPAKEYKYPTIAQLCNYIDFQSIETGTAVPSIRVEGNDTIDVPFVFTNGTEVYESHISSASSTWNLKEDYNTKIQGYENASDTILFGSQFRGVSGSKITLGEFEVSADAEIEVYWQPNGTSERGMKIYNLYDEEDLVEDLITFENKNVFVVSKFPIKKGYYDHEIAIQVMKNTINIAGINITNLVAPKDGLSNVENGVKAVKVMENGQLVIIKNGVRYNAMGAKL